MRHLRQQLGRLLDETATTARPLDEAPAQVGEMDDMALQANQDVAYEDAIQQQLAHIGEQLEKLSRLMATQEPFQAPQRPEEVPGYAELKTALHNLVEHLELAEGRTAEAITALRERMEEIAARTTEAMRLIEAGDASAQDVQALKERIAILDRRLDELQRAGAAQTHERIEERLHDIDKRLQAMEEFSIALPRQLERLATTAPAADSRITQMVEHMREKLDRLASDVRNAQSLRKELESLSAQVASLKTQVAQQPADDAFTQMRDSLQRLSRQVEEKPDRSDLAALETRLQELAAQFAARPSSDADERLPALEEQVLSLRKLVEEALGAPLADIADKLESHEQRLLAISENDSRLQRLEKAIEQLRAALADRTEDVSPADGDEIAALKAGIADVERFAHQADRQTREMLAAVQQTLAEIVNRLVALEERETTGDTSAMNDDAGAAPASAGEPDADFLLAEEAPGQTAGGPPEKGERAGAFDPAEISRVVAALEQQTPEKEPRRRTSQDGAPSKAAALPEEETKKEPSREDFIAAARRAALAAAAKRPQEKVASGFLAGLLGKRRHHEKDAPGAETSGLLAQNAPLSDVPPAPDAGAAPERQARSSSSGGVLRFFRSRSPASSKMPGREETMTSAPPPKAPDNGAGATKAPSSRKRLLLAGLVLLSAVALLLSQRQQPRPPTTTKPLVQQNVVPQGPATRAPSPPSMTAPGEGARGKPRPQEGAPSAGHSAIQRLPGGATTTGLFVPGGSTVVSVKKVASGKAATARPVATVAGAPIHTGSINALKAAAPSPASSRQTRFLPPEIGPAALRRAAENGDGKAAFLVATRFLHGEGVARNLALARHWFGKAAEKGVVVAMFRLGVMNEQGIGGTRDEEQARAWYERAALRGNVRAMHNLGVLLASGRLGRPDYEKAAYWFRKAGEHGVRDSQFNLAVLYHRGQGVPRDLAEAWFWYELAARQGDAAAARQANRLAAFLGRKKLDEQRRRLTSFHLKAPIRNANVVVIEHPQWRTQKAGLRQDASSGKASESLPAKALVREVQRLLRRIGYDVGPVDGRLGNRTANAIRLFQLQNRLPVNGRPDERLLRRLRALLNTT